MNNLFTARPKGRSYVENPDLPAIHPNDYFEQLEPRIILGSCLAFGGAEVLLSQADADEPKKAIAIPAPEFLNELPALRSARTAPRLSTLYSFRPPQWPLLGSQAESGGCLRNQESGRPEWLVPDAGGVSLPGKEVAAPSGELPEVASRQGHGGPVRGMAPRSGGASTSPKAIDGGGGVKEPEFIITPVAPPGGGGDPGKPVDPASGSPVLGASGASSIPVGKEYTLTISITGPGSGTVKHWTIDWGDGKVEQFDGNPDNVKHIYERTGDYVIKTSAVNADKTYSGPSVSVRVTENRPPEFVSKPNAEAGVGRPWRYDSRAVDPDGDDLTYSLVSGPGGMSIDSATGRLSWTPEAGYVGQHQVVIEARDPGGLSCRQEFTLTVVQNLQNRPPEITSTPESNAYTGKEYVYQVAARDPDGDALTYSLVGGPTGMTIDAQSGRLVWTPAAGMEGKTVSVSILVEDGYGGSATQTYQITVLKPKNNAAPVFVSKPETTHYTPGAIGTATGNVSVNGINMALDIDEIKKQVVSMKIDDLPPMVDIFLFFDCSNSFVQFARSFVEEFPKIIKALTEAMPEVSFAFGIGTHVTYGGEEGYRAGNRPFILRQPMVASDTEGFIDSIIGAIKNYPVSNNACYLLSTLEALYQIATGKGFDGNNDGDTTDSGPAGPRYNQNNPGTSGDVPAFGSFVPDPANNVLPPAGDIGGVGFRKGSLPIIIAATDEEFWYQPDGRETIVGRDGVEIKSSYFDRRYPTNTPFGNGATIQETIDALNHIGAVVVGWGTERARHGMDALSRLTGSVNGSNDEIDTGYNQQTIKKGDPYFFRMQQEASKVSAGLIQMIRSIMLNTANSIEVIASKGGVPFDNLTGVIKDVAPGDTVDFEVSFRGDGREHSFDIQFVKAGTGVVLGSIPVTMGASYTYDAKAVDPDGDEVTYSLSGETHGATINSLTGSISWSPDRDGVYRFTVVARDTFGNSVEQIYDVQVGDRPYESGLPTIHGITSRQAEVGRQFSSQVEADSPNGESLTYYLGGDIPEGLTINKMTGEISWLPALGQDNAYPLVIRVISSEGAMAEKAFTLEVLSKQLNRNTKPTFASKPVETAVINKEYRYQVKAKDAEGDPITLRLLMAPDGLAFDADSGLLVWKPGEADLGDHSVVIQADDGNGGLNLQVFTIVVDDGNLPPVFTSVPPAPSYAGSNYMYVVKAGDPNGDPVRFSLDDDSIARGVTLDAETGLLVWNAIPAGEYQIAITASDGRGGESLQTFVLKITANRPARITSDAVTIAIKGYQYAYHITTEDPNGDPVSLTLDQASLDRGMFIDADGVLRWMPDAVGEYAVTLTAADPSGAGMTQKFMINVVHKNVVANRSPVITSIPETVVWENVAYIYKVIASDPDGDALTYKIATNASGLSISGSGTVSWSSPRAGDYLVTITVSDKLGAQAIQTFKLTVNSRINRHPYITSLPRKHNFNIGELFSYSLHFSDPDSGDICTATLDADSLARGMTIAPSGNNYANIVWTPSEAGYFTTTVTVTDKGGSRVTQTFTLRVFDPSENIDQNRPPRITSVPKTTTGIGQEYQYRITANDPDGHALQYFLDAESLARGMTISADGIVSWTPGAEGEFAVSVTVMDVFGARCSQAFVLKVVQPQIHNKPAYFTSEFELLGKVGVEYRCRLEGEDPEGGEVKFSLASGPSGMKLEGNELVWTPTYQGWQWVTVTVEDAEGNGEKRKFRIRVIYPDTTNYDCISSYAGELIEHTIVPRDSWGNIVSWTLDAASINRGMTFENGVLRWTPTAANDYSATIRIVNDQNRAISFVIYMYVINRNQPPVITSTPQTTAIATERYEYQVEAYDPEGGPLTYAYNYSQHVSGVSMSARVCF